MGKKKELKRKRRLDRKSKCEKAKRIIAEKEKEIKKLARSELKKRAKVKAEIQKQKGVIEARYTISRK